MKVTTATTLALVAAIGANAQSSSTASVPPVVTKYEYYDDCSTSGAPNVTATVTGTITSTYCPECREAASMNSYTTYTTVYKEWCPTGLREKTYTITESCSELGQEREATYVPQGFTVVTEACSICKHPTTAVITTPCSETAAAATAPTVYAAPKAPGAAATAPVAPAAPAATAPASGPMAAASAPLAPAAAAPTVYGAPMAATETLVPGTPAGPSSNGTISPPIQNFRSGAVSSSPAAFALLAGVALFAAIQYAH